MCWVIPKPQSGHCRIFFNLSTFTGAGRSSTIGSSTIASTGSFVILIFGLALGLGLDLGFGLTSSSSSSIIVSITASYMVSPLLIISSTSSLDSSVIFEWYIFLTKINSEIN